MKINTFNSILFDKKCPTELDTLIEIIDFSRFEQIDLVIDNIICHDISINHLVELNNSNDLVVTFIELDFIENDTDRLMIRMFLKSRDKKKLIHL